MEFVVRKNEVSEAEKEAASGQIPVQVQVLLDAFKGTVVTGK